MTRTLMVALRTSIVLMVLCGLLYPLVVTGIAQAVMPGKANGSLIYNDKHEVIGSELIGQTFTGPNYFHGRVSSIDYNGASSGSPNYAPSNEAMIKRTADAVETWKKENPDVPVSGLPVDLITNSASGLDPDITPEAARAQISRISKATGLSTHQLEDLVHKHTKTRELGIFGEPVVNVLQLNLDLQKEAAGK
ncbi:potassium-transporting ATPase subunit KdpC [Paenibacillus caui]|uniref:potassium-transporting ATPase subunit KdpC n=1 Tax=Paenibacillus caui TaxID=2873927 RepID=UPI001EFF8864|nr:potassium-transporting ATPase subunit KdpC [Paenibacillus caui]